MWTVEEEILLADGDGEEIQRLLWLVPPQPDHGWDRVLELFLSRDVGGEKEVEVVEAAARGSAPRDRSMNFIIMGEGWMCPYGVPKA